MGKLSSLSGKERTRLIVSVACLPVIAAAGVALVIGNSWAFGDGASTMNTYLTTPAPADTSAMTRSSSGMGDELAVEVEGEGIVMLENNGTLPLSKDTVKKVNVFGHGSVDWYIMSSGSEMVGTKGHKSYDFNSALEKRGLEVNPNLPAYYKDWQKTEIWGITFRDGMRLNSKYWGNMVFVQAAQVDFHFCRFLNNDSQTDDDANGSNGAIEIWGSAVRCFDCIFRDNITAKGSGAAFQVRPRQSNSSSTDPLDASIAYFERCEFRNNIAYGTVLSVPGAEKWGTYGGNCSVSDNGGSVYLVNCLVADSKCWYRGVGIRVGSNASAYFINNTFYNNPCRQRSNRGSNNGSAVSAGTNSKNYFAGNIMVEYAANDDFTSSDAVVFIQAASTAAYSAGYNVIGTVMNNSTVENSGFIASDNIPTSLETVNTIESIFGTNAIANQGGVCDVVAPLADVAPIDMAALKTAIAAWPVDDMAKVMDLDKDQRGYTRAATTVAGSYDPNGVEPVWVDPTEGVENIGSAVKCTKTIRDGQVVILRGSKTYNTLGQEL